MSTIPSTPEERAKKVGVIASWLALGVACFVISPFVLAAIGGLLGGIAFMAIAGTAYFSMPAIATTAANYRLKMLKAAAAANPVETLLSEHQAQSVMLDDRKSGLEQMGGAIRTLEQTIDQLRTEFPDSPELPGLVSDCDELNQLYTQREQDWEAAKVSLGEFRKEITRVSRLWDVSLAAKKARAQSGLTSDEWESKLKTETAVYTIRTQLNSQLAALRTDKMQADADRILKGRQAKAALPAPAGAVIDVTPVATPVKVRA